MELIKLCTDNSMGYTYYYNPKFDYLAFKCSNGNIAFNKIISSKVTPNNKILIIVSESDLSEYNPIYSQLLWFFKVLLVNITFNSLKQYYLDIGGNTLYGKNHNIW